MKTNVWLSLVVAWAAAAAASAGTLKLAPFYGHNMVLQRDRPVVLLGQADANAEVKASLLGSEGVAKAGADGLFRLVLPAQGVRKDGFEFVVTSSGAERLAFTNVVVGDVWLCSGQSNMEWGMAACRPLLEKDLAEANFPLIRHVKFSRETALDPVGYMGMKVDPWTAAEPGQIGGWTAVGYYFARRIHQNTGIPVGLLGSNWGGTRIEPWTPAEAFRGDSRFADEVKVIEDRVALKRKSDEAQKAYQDALAAAADKASVKKPSQPWNQQSPTAIYNAMVDGLTQFPICGAIWYQGESNAGNKDYEWRKKAMIEGWRTKWGYEFPFYFVQLASFMAASEDPAAAGWGSIRQQQANTLKIVPKTGMAVALDIGDAMDIHPKNKFDVGERLARWALRDVYGDKAVVVSGPLFSGVEFKDGRAVVSFDYADCCGLMVGSKSGLEPAVEDAATPLQGFALQGADGTWKWAQAVIDGAKVVVSCPEVKEPVAVRYAYQSNPKANLYNKAGLPASPFTSER